MAQESNASSTSPFTVTSLTSNVNASNRNFACNNEEIIYRCETTSTNNESFITGWLWNGTLLDKTFNSTDRIGEDNTCNTLKSKGLDFLHLTLVSTENNICVSLLIVRSSLPSYHVNNNATTITCEAFGDSSNHGTIVQPQQSKEIYHNPVSSESCMHVS